MTFHVKVRQRKKIASNENRYQLLSKYYIANRDML